MQTVKLSADILAQAKIHAAVNSRSVPKQVEYWFRIGKMAEENPDLPYRFIRDILLSQAEAEAEETEPYAFD